jgi:V/A-type H+-transporting ATPase subunit E
MAIEDIIKKIETDSEEKANSRKAEAEAEAKKILDRAREEAKEKRCAILKKGEEEAERIRRRTLQIADLEVRKIILSAKRQVISDVFEQVRNRLEELKNYQDLVGKMLLAGAETGEEEVMISARDNDRIDQKFIDSINTKLPKQGKKGALKLAKETIPITGGFVLRRGKVEIDNSFGSLIKSRKDELEIKVAEILFS